MVIEIIDNLYRDRASTIHIGPEYKNIRRFSVSLAISASVSGH